QAVKARHHASLPCVRCPYGGRSGMNHSPINKAYLDAPPRLVPGFHSLHRMISMLLAERTPPDGRVLVLGAGGGLELKALAEAHPGWLFDGVDPSGDMLRLAEWTVGPLGVRM